jgi:hypothetical protein
MNDITNDPHMYNSAPTSKATMQAALRSARTQPCLT